MKRREMLFLLGGLLSLPMLAAHAADQDRDQDRDREELRQRVYGWELMTDAERNEYRERMRNMRTDAEREAFRLEHHKQMQERARERGVTLPDVPMGPGRGMGPGNGMGPGSGMGPGNGMGPGMGKGPGR